MLHQHDVINDSTNYEIGVDRFHVVLAKELPKCQKTIGLQSVKELAKPTGNKQLTEVVRKVVYEN